MITGLTWGCFDLLHYGHINFLSAARRECDRLVVGLHGDQWIKDYKGIFPVFSFVERYKLLDQLKCVSRIICNRVQGDKDTLIASLSPDILLVGNDWTPETYPNMKYGIPVKFIPYTEGISSTIIRNKTNLTRQI